MKLPRLPRFQVVDFIHCAPDNMPVRVEELECNSCLAHGITADVGERPHNPIAARMNVALDAVGLDTNAWVMPLGGLRVHGEYDDANRNREGSELALNSCAQTFGAESAA
nr:hypothetical protein [Dyella solisilvae]